MAMRSSTIIIIHGFFIFFFVAVCYSRTPKGKNEKVIKNQQKKTIKIQNKIKINKTVKNNNNKKQLITKNVYISKLQHR